MGYDKTQVYDVQAEPTRPLDEIVEAITRLMDADQWYAKAQWYAMGRMHYEAAPLELPGEDGRDDEEGSAAGFALQYQQMMADFVARKRPDVIGVAKAWEHYAASLGGTIEENQAGA